MTENVNLSNVDFVNYGHDVHRLHETKATGRNISTWLGIIAAVLLVVALWAIFMRNRTSEKTTEKETNVNLGGNGEAIEGLKAQVRMLQGYERADYGKIMFNDGVLYGKPCYSEEHEHGRCGHGRKGNCDSRFQNVKTFNVASEVVTQTNTCDCG